MKFCFLRFSAHSLSIPNIHILLCGRIALTFHAKTIHVIHRWIPLNRQPFFRNPDGHEKPHGSEVCLTLTALSNPDGSTNFWGMVWMPRMWVPWVIHYQQWYRVNQSHFVENSECSFEEGYKSV